MNRSIYYALAIVSAAWLSVGNVQAQTTTSPVGAAGSNPVSQPEFELTSMRLRTDRAGSQPSRIAFHFVPGSSWFPNSTGPLFSITPAAAGANLPVTGGGTVGRLTKWTGFSSNNSFLGDTTIFEDKYGNVGIGTDSPTSRLTVGGMIQTTTGGITFPDGTVQATSATGALFSVAHDATLRGNGTAASPLAVASPIAIRDLDNPARQPFQGEANCSTTQPSCIVFPANVPSGKRLVIEYVSMQAFIPAGEVAQLTVDVVAGGKLASHALPLSSPAIPFGLVTTAIISQQVRMYVDAGLGAELVGARSGSGGSASFFFSISGHLVDLP